MPKSSLVCSMFALFVALPSISAASPIVLQLRGQLSPGIVDAAGIFGQVGRLLPRDAEVIETFTFEPTVTTTDTNRIDTWGDRGTLTLSVGDLTYSTTIDSHDAFTAGLATSVPYAFQTQFGLASGVRDQVSYSLNGYSSDNAFGIFEFGIEAGKTPLLTTPLSFENKNLFNGVVFDPYICADRGACFTLVAGGESSGDYAVVESSALFNAVPPTPPAPPVDEIPVEGPIDVHHQNKDQPGNTVPEPASLAIVGLGLAGIGAARRRRR